MTLNDIEELAQLMHREAMFWSRQHRPDWRTASWEELPQLEDGGNRQEQYRAVARVVLRKLGR